MGFVSSETDYVLRSQERGAEDQPRVSERRVEVAEELNEWRSQRGQLTAERLWSILKRPKQGDVTELTR